MFKELIRIQFLQSEISPNGPEAGVGMLKDKKKP